MCKRLKYNSCIYRKYNLMSAGLLFKIIIFILLALILASLGSGLLFLVRDQGKTRRVITSLTLRIILSISLFIMLIIGYATGLIKPHGVSPTAPDQTTDRH